MSKHTLLLFVSANTRRVLYFLPVDILNRFRGQHKPPKKQAAGKTVLVPGDNAAVSSLQDWKDHQHICCQSSGMAVHEDEPITPMDMDKVK